MTEICFNISHNVADILKTFQYHKPVIQENSVFHIKPQIFFCYEIYMLDKLPHSVQTKPNTITVSLDRKYHKLSYETELKCNKATFIIKGNHQQILL